MAQAREVMDRLTAAVFTTRDLKAAAECYADDAVAVTPDQGEITGSEQISEYMRQFVDAFPDLHYEYLQKHDSGNVAIDEGVVIGTNTGPLPLPSGETLPATGKQIRIRGCDVVTVDGGLVTNHRFYFDQIEFLAQLDLLPELPT
ncbi:MAG: ester cyclase [Actinomycetes bacterium]